MSLYNKKLNFSFFFNRQRKWNIQNIEFPFSFLISVGLKWKQLLQNQQPIYKRWVWKSHQRKTIWVFGWWKFLWGRWLYSLKENCGVSMEGETTCQGYLFLLVKISTHWCHCDVRLEQVRFWRDLLLIFVWATCSWNSKYRTYKKIHQECTNVTFKQTHFAPFCYLKQTCRSWF